MSDNYSIEIFATVTDASKWCNNGKTSLKSHIAQQIKGQRKSSELILPQKKNYIGVMLIKE